MSEATYTYACWMGDVHVCCWLKQFSERPCEGRMDRAHLIPKQTMKRSVGVFRGDVSIYDERVWVPACRFHHGQFDNHRLTVPRERLPESLLSFCDELGLTWYLDRRYGESRVEVAPE